MFKILEKIQSTADASESLAQVEQVFDEATKAIVDECCDMFADTLLAEPEDDETTEAENGPTEEEQADQRVVDLAILAEGKNYYFKHSWANGGKEAYDRYAAAYQRVHGVEYNPCVC